MTQPRKAVPIIRTAAILAATSCIGACANSGQTAARTAVTPAEFRSHNANANGSPQQSIPVAPALQDQSAEPGVEVIVLTGSPGSESNPRTITLGASDAAASGEPTIAAPINPPHPSQSGYVFDAYLGQVNGKPIYAAEFLDPMDARLAAESKRMSDRDWQRFAAGEIARSLRDILQDELLLAEFRASLSEQERVGIGAFVERIRQGFISESGGSREAARARLLAAEGLTLNQKVDDEVKRAFIREQIRREISESISISFRDIEVYYDLHPEEFAPPPTARLRMIQAPLNDPEKIKRIEAALQSGVPFKDIAQAETAFNRIKAGELEKQLYTPKLADAEIIGVEALNNAARTLSVGEVSPRIDANDSAWWIKLEELDAAPAKSLYEAQFEIEEKLLEQRFSEAERKYFRRIVGRAGLADQEDVAIKLLEFAAHRYRSEG